jgi:hypothetical protein
MTKTKTSNRSQSFESRSFSNVLRRPTSDSHASVICRLSQRNDRRISPISLTVATIALSESTSTENCWP